MPDSSPAGQMPNFLLVGTTFAGAETLLDWLGQHPQIHASPIRETNYFACQDLGTEGVLDTALLSRPHLNADGSFRAASVARVTSRRNYERCFQPARKPAALRFGEASPAYFLYPHAARRIAEQIPYCKIVAVLRHPVERLLAHYSAFEQQGREHLSLETALEHEERRLTAGWSFQWAYLGLSSYTAALARYLARFALPQIHLVRAEDLQSPEQRPAAWRALLHFLEVDAEVPAPDSAGSGDACLSPASGVTEIADSTRHSLSARLRTETNFYRELFSEPPFRRTTLRRLARADLGGDTDGDWQADDEPAAADGTPDEGSVFQHLLFTGDPVRGPLYHRNISYNHRAHPRISQSGGIKFVEDEVFSFDGFFNAFFESLVAEHTGMSSIQLRLKFTGRFFVEVFRLAQGCAPQLVTSVQSERRPGDDALVLELHLSTDSPLGSRLAFHLTCLSKEGWLTGGGWWTLATARRAVQLDILACTYKKPEFIERTVRRIADYDRLPRDEYFITVVDNASDLPDDLFAYPNVRIVHQGNVGGAGGAARGLIEGLTAQGRTPPTHFLLMDDDIELEPDMVLRAMNWLRHLKVDQCVGGGMLDLYHPTHLHELGSTIGRPKILSIAACVGKLELAPAGSLDRLGKLPESHYNAWWFMTISRAAVEEHGLPLPCFIRGDDKELGFRMRAKGVPTLAVPGIAVWHMPFYAKTAAWLYYYDLYNDLLLRALRHPELTGDVLADAVWGEIKHYLERLEYDQAAMRVLGLEHFLRGPEWLSETDCEARFKGIMHASKEFAAEHRKDVEPTKFDAHYKPKSGLDRRWRRWIHNGHLPLSRRKPVYTTSGLPRKVVRISDWAWSDVTYFDEIGVKHALVPGIYVFRKRPEVYFGLLRRAKAGLAVLRREWPERAAAFRGYDAELTSPAFWRRYLRLKAQEIAVTQPEVARDDREIVLGEEKPLSVPTLAGV